MRSSVRPSGKASARSIPGPPCGGALRKLSPTRLTLPADPETRRRICTHEEIERPATSLRVHLGNQMNCSAVRSGMPRIVCERREFAVIAVLASLRSMSYRNTILKIISHEWLPNALSGLFHKQLGRARPSTSTRAYLCRHHRQIARTVECEWSLVIWLTIRTGRKRLNSHRGPRVNPRQGSGVVSRRPAMNRFQSSRFGARNAVN
jgi:hypothetical protein